MQAVFSANEIRTALLGAIQQILGYYRPTESGAFGAIERSLLDNRRLEPPCYFAIDSILRVLAICSRPPEWGYRITEPGADATQPPLLKDVLRDLSRLRDWIADAELNPVPAKKLTQPLKAFLVQASKGNTIKDGPQPSGKFRWKGNEYKMPPLVSRTIEFMWHKIGVEDLEFMHHVWGHEVNESNLKKHVSTTNKSLLESGYNRSLRRAGGRVFWE